MLEVDIHIEYESVFIDTRFSLADGEGVALMGPSGAGKSSILSVIAGFYQAARSEVIFRGKRLDGLQPAERPLTILFQEHNLFSHLTIWQNIAIGLDPRLKLNPAQAEVVSDALQWVGLSGFEQRMPATLSGGQKQRVALARCLAREQPLLLLDEPFTGLDQQRHAEMRELVKLLITEKKMTLVLSTHQPKDAKWLCSQVVEVTATPV